MSAQNQEQIDYWNGRAGERWTTNQEALDRTFEPVGTAVMDAAGVRPGERILDVGCGCGATTLELARRVGPGGHVLGVDISAPMLARAQARLQARPPGDATIQLQVADASVAALPADRDVVFSRFGVMFFADPVAAFAHLRACAPAGRLAFACWRPAVDNEWARVPSEAVAPHLPAESPPTPGAPGPFAFADRDRTRRLLEEAGWSGVAIEPRDLRLRWTESPDVDVAVELFTQVGPAARRLAEAPPEVRDTARRALRVALSRHVSRDGSTFGAAIWIVTASA